MKLKDMKNWFKRLTMAVCAVSTSIMIMTASVPVFADNFRSGPGNNTTASDSADVTGSSSGEAANTGGASDSAAGNAETNNVTTQTSGTATVNNKKYLSKMGGFLWFLLSVIVNFVISCWVGNRFYRMARRSAQSSNEIRALRKDIEEKFAGTLKDISEPATEVMNRNEAYSRTDEGITMPERRQHVELSGDEAETMRRWDSKRAAAKGAGGMDEDEEDYFEPRGERRTAKRAYQPTRRSSGIEFEEDVEEEEYDDLQEEKNTKHRQAKRPINSNAISNAKNKAKDLISNVFPFDE